MTRTVDTKEAAELLGISENEFEQWVDDAEKGILHGEPSETVFGRPLLFGEEMQQVGFREPLSKIMAIDARAKQLGMKRSEYLRHLVDEDLKKVKPA